MHDTTTTTIAGQPPSASHLTLSQIMDQHHTNLIGTVHGGRILNLIDSVAGMVAARHSDRPAVTAAIDETAFLRAVRVGDVVHVEARITWASRSSMEVAVKITADRWDRAVPPTDVATAHLVMVAIDDHGQPDRGSPPVKQPQRYPEGGQIGGQPGADGPGGARSQQHHGRC
ncbi:acyl-CoA thioesterase [Salinispora arenicola]|uniref:acyl-CoA thioesterase n=1 Tax=Salinispora arenicola TaxID=168697 RepID=UPI00039E6E07|nr:acyl-CoA thioesterase [Salinispora arenicola]